MSDRMVPTKSAYRDLLATLASQPNQFGPLVLSFARTGSPWNRELMVCGRAPNGLDTKDEITAEHLHSYEAREVRIEQWERSPDHQDLDWVAQHWAIPTSSGYYTRRSAFWRVTRKVARLVCSPHVDDAGWSSSLAWTNLYHVAPARSGNPRSRLIGLQASACVRLLESDVTRLDPKRLLVLAGHDWAAPFFAHDVTWHPDHPFLQGSGLWTLPNGRRVAVVIARHPQGKREGPMVSAVVEAFGELGPT